VADGRDGRSVVLIDIYQSACPLLLIGFASLFHFVPAQKLARLTIWLK
jgi:hypothetical protein